MNARTALTLCVTLVIGGVVLTGLASGLGYTNEPTALNDAWLTTKTKIALFTDARVMGREITVESTQGLVMIRGNVKSDETKQTAEGIANRIDGVKSVKNDLHVVQPAQREVVNNTHKVVALQDQTAPCQDQAN